MSTSPANPHRLTLQTLPNTRGAIQLDTHDPRRDLVSRSLHAQRVWEPFESRLWLAAHRPDDVVLDVGANLGYFSVLSAQCQASPRLVIAAEPSADNFQLLESNIALNPSPVTVVPVRVALGDRTRRGSLYLSEDNLGDHQIYAGDGERREDPIEVVHGGSLIERHTRIVDLLKIDTQGSEYAVVQGLFELLAKSRDKLRMLIELTPWSLRCAGSSGRELLERLSELDLPVAIVDHIEHRLVPSTYAELCRWCDNVDATPDDRGFMNVFLGEPPDKL